MGDSITLSGSGEMDNGMSISLSFEIDNDDTGGGDVYDSHSMTLDTNGYGTCLLYTSDAADEEDSVDLGGRRIIKKKKKKITYNKNDPN